MTTFGLSTELNFLPISTNGGVIITLLYIHRYIHTVVTK